ncbi:CPBP family intramembrane glutamic endopeptidase [Companilactobacillus sp. HBUAS56275]|uniref:CPBP family intramembrane metalloprotease n=1 Tax=Candidatus Companilactobacillus pullicola TaxID=2838523 RepID=A0A9D1ZM77_9LACO|nr:CPBP family intramembrane metalloprotease [Candidatus Companilactobacillus pullicola]
MKFIKSNLVKIIIASLIFPIVMFLLALVIRGHSVNSYWQMLSDLLVFVIAFLLNRFFFQQKINWFNTKNWSAQLYTAMPAIILIAVLDSATLAVPDMAIKLKVIVLCLLVGLAEEYIFRGILISLFLKLFHNNVLGAVIGSSIMFGLIHTMNLKSLPIGYVSGQVIFAAAIGLLFGTIYVKTKNLSIVILLHALRDMFPMFSNKLMAEAAKMQFSMSSLYVIAVLFLITFFIAYAQLKDFKIEKEPA